ncbi:pilus assembly protein [Myxococcota bacterium]|nr:pilus assembly protein [Myxococcota bacterium]
MTRRIAFFRNTRGQALVEFVVAVPTMVLIFLFSQFFYEAIQVKLKTQEMARYMAWEFTGRALHDYDDGSFKYSDVSTEIKTDAANRFSNLRSTDLRNDADMALAGKWTVNTPTTQNGAEPLLPGGTLFSIGGFPIDINMVFRFAGYVLDGLRLLSIAKHPNVYWAAMAAYYTIQENTMFGGGALSRFNPPSGWKLNTRGYIRTQVRVTFENMWLNNIMAISGDKFWSKDNQGKSEMRSSIRRLRFTETYYLLADQWELHQPDDVVGPSSSGTAYYKQINRMAFMDNSMRRVLKGFTDAVKYGTDIVAYMAFQPTLGMSDLTQVGLVSKNYEGGSGGRESGQIEIDEDSGKKTYDTSPMMDKSTSNVGVKMYEESRSTRGNNYMACPQVESLGCTSSLSQDNPFGDYIIPEELE